MYTSSYKSQYKNALVTSIWVTDQLLTAASAKSTLAVDIFCSWCKSVKIIRSFCLSKPTSYQYGFITFNSPILIKFNLVKQFTTHNSLPSGKGMIFQVLFVSRAANSITIALHHTEC